MFCYRHSKRPGIIMFCYRYSERPVIIFCYMYSKRPAITSRYRHSKIPAIICTVKYLLLYYAIGTVKDHDVKTYPPFGILQPEIRYNKLGQRLLPGRRSANGSSYGSRQTESNARAKSGFQYWYKEPKSNISRKWL